MGKHKLNDRELEELLRKLPKIEDGRSKEEIYARLAFKSKRRRRTLKVMPALAAAGVIALIFTLAPTLFWEQAAFDKESFDKSESLESAANDSDVRGGGDVKIMEEGSTDKETLNGTIYQNTAYEPLSVYLDDLADYDPITYSIPDQNANVVVPITVLVDKKEDKTWFNQFVSTMTRLDEEAWGLQEYFPLDAILAYDEETKTVRVDLPTSHPYADGSASETLFLKTLEESFPVDKVEKIEFTTEGAKGIQLGNYGETFVIENDDKVDRAYMFLYPKMNKIPYMVPTDDTSSSFEEALHRMASPDPGAGLSPSIPSELDVENIEVEEFDDLVVLDIDQPIETTEQLLYSLEAIFLTAKSFGYEKIKLDIHGIDAIGPFDLSQAVTVPVAANKKILSEVE